MISLYRVLILFICVVAQHPTSMTFKEVGETNQSQPLEISELGSIMVSVNRGIYS
jgi:hypothetical protein